jgi:hypothetical protein
VIDVPGVVLPRGPASDLAQRDTDGAAQDGEVIQRHRKVLQTAEVNDLDTAICIASPERGRGRQAGRPQGLSLKSMCWPLEREAVGIFRDAGLASHRDE